MHQNQHGLFGIHAFPTFVDETTAQSGEYPDNNIAVAILDATVSFGRRGFNFERSIRY
jgi:hypothetical protein